MKILLTYPNGEQDRLQLHPSIEQEQKIRDHLFGLLKQIPNGSNAKMPHSIYIYLFETYAHLKYTPSGENKYSYLSRLEAKLSPPCYEKDDCNVEVGGVPCPLRSDCRKCPLEIVTEARAAFNKTGEWFAALHNSKEIPCLIPVDKKAR